MTHVYINEPSKGYAIFAETMIREANGKAIEAIGEAVGEAIGEAIGDGV